MRIAGAHAPSCHSSVILGEHAPPAGWTLQPSSAFGVGRGTGSGRIASMLWCVLLPFTIMWSVSRKNCGLLGSSLFLPHEAHLGRCAETLAWHRFRPCPCCPHAITNASQVRTAVDSLSWRTRCVMSGIVPLLESSNSCFSLRLTLLALDLFSDPLMVINFIDLSLRIFFCLQHKAVLMRQLPDGLKLNIAQRIENNLFSKVGLRTVIFRPVVFSIPFALHLLERSGTAISCRVIAALKFRVRSLQI